MGENTEGTAPEKAAESETTFGQQTSTVAQTSPIEEVKNIEPPSAESQSQGHLGEENGKDHRQPTVQTIDRLQTWFNGGLLSVGLLEIGILVFQICLFSRQNSIMDTQNTIMTKTNEIMENQVRVENRPWLRVASVKVTKIKETQRIFCTLEFTVAGHVPANVRRVVIESFPTAKNSDVHAMVSKGQGSPGDEFHAAIPSEVPVPIQHRSSFSVTAKKLKDFNDLQLRLWVVGRIEYTDISADPRDPPSVTRFAFASDQAKPLAVGDSLELQLEYSGMD